MKKFKKTISLLLVMAVLCSMAVFSFSVNAAETDEAEVNADTGITIHYYTESKTVPYIYYWNSLPTNITMTDYPGKQMERESEANWYKISFNNVTKINFLFVDNGEQSRELTRNTGEWYYKNGRWSTDRNQTNELTDFREESIYFVITTRFYDGDTGNNVHCWDDKKANNPDTDPAWRGDFKGLIDKLDYIKALGFTAIWITPVVTNASGYDYHGYHAFDLSTVDVRYESSGATFQDLIDAVHAKGMKLIQDVVINHTGNFGEAFLAPMFTKEYSSVQDLASIDSMKAIPDSDFAKTFPNYSSLDADSQYQARLNIMKNTHKFSNSEHDLNNYYHHYTDMSWESPSEQTGQIDGDCVDVNTENPVVAEYINECYNNYISMGVDAFRMDTEKHVSRLTLNQYYFPSWLSAGGENFFVFGEVCTRVNEYWNKGVATLSAPFYTWGETESKYINCFGNDWEANVNLTLKHYDEHKDTNGQPTSNNVFLNGIEYHTPDYSKANGTSVIDFPMHWNFDSAGNAYRIALQEDAYFNDSSWNVTYVDSHDYGPNMNNRYTGGEQAWAENLSLMFTFRGIPCLYYGSEVEFQKGVRIDPGNTAALSTTGRAYFGDYLEGNVTASDFGVYNASGKVEQTLNSPLAVHLRQLNLIRQAVPALQKGQYTTSSTYVDGHMAYVRRYTNKNENVDSLALVTVSGSATFKNIPNGKYIDAVTGDVQNVTNGTLTVPSLSKGNARVYVCCANGFTGISGKIGQNGTYLK